MSYQVLARKWRPAKFEQVVGQTHVLNALTNALTDKRLHHAYLFSGTRGVGKTTLARLFAKGLNCELGITAQPCGQCSSCVEIAEGRFVDLIEVDAASRTKVDDTRELLDNVQYRPARGRYKVYLIDEVHMLSRSSFNALLKTLEEPPEHVKFLLATTEPQKLPVTVLSRCLQFNLKSLTVDDIDAQVANILTEESIHFEGEAIQLIAKAANGSMRDALSITDQAIAFGAGQVCLTQVQTMLGTIDEHYVIALFEALVQGDVANVMRVNDEVLSFGAGADEVLASLLELLHQISLTQFAPAAAQLTKHTSQIKEFASRLKTEQVQLYYQLLLTGRKDLPHAPNAKIGLEMALLRAVEFVPEPPINRWPTEPDSGDSKDLSSSGLKSKSPLSVDRAPTETTEPRKSVDTAANTNANTNTVSDAHLPDDSTPDAPIKASKKEVVLVDSSAVDTNVVDISAVDTSVEEDSPTAETITDDDAGIIDGHEEAPFALKAMVDAEQIPLENQQERPDTVDTPPSNDSIDALLDAAIASCQSLRDDLDIQLAEDPDAKNKANSSKPSVSKISVPEPSVLKPSVSESGISKSKTSESTVLESTVSESTVSESNASERIEPTKQADDTLPLPQILTDEGDSNNNSFVPPVTSTEKQDVSLNSPSPTAVPESCPPAVKGEIKGNDTDLRWYRLVSTLDIGARVRQLAVNSVCLQFSEPLPLQLKPNQKHLASPEAIAQLQASLSNAFTQPCQIAVNVGAELERETPLEIRTRFHQELLTDAEHHLKVDDNIKWLEAKMDAQMNIDSLSYSAAMFSQRKEAIALIDKSNFVDSSQPQ